MSDAISPSRWRRLRFTPLRDVVRLRLTGRLDWRSAVRASSIDDAAKSLVIDVVHLTRLWRLEKAGVARELVTHFEDAAEAGESHADAIAAFGEVRLAAKLIRRGKIRNRPLPWHAMRWSLRAVAALVVLVGLAGVYFAVGRPTVSHDYLAEINAPIVATPVQQRAWPEYYSVLLDMTDMPALSAVERVFDAGMRKEPETRDWIARHGPLMERIRQAADKPALGFVLGPNGDAYAPQLLNGRQPTFDDPIDRDMIVTTLLPHLNPMLSMAIQLSIDAELAREAGDGQRIRRDLLAILAMSEQLRRESGGFLVTQLVALDIRDIAITGMRAALSDAPQLFADADLRDLSHRLAGPRVASDLLSLAGERASFHDAVQRMYTDNGAGDGRLTPKGLQIVNMLGTTIISNRGEPWSLQMVMTPAVRMLGTSRKKVLDDYDREIARIELAMQQPYRVWAKASDEPQESAQLPVTLVRLWGPSGLSVTHWSAQRALAERDGVLVGIALELHRRRTGEWPASLDALVPGLLPAVPEDPFTGDPLKYRIVDGKPLVYSVATDRTDDGGAPVIDTKSKKIQKQLPWEQNQGDPITGDWVLFPAMSDQQ